MAILSTYELDPSLTGDDLLLGSSYTGTVNGIKQYKTSSYSLSDLAGYFSQNFEVGGELYDISKISTRVDNLQLMFTYDAGDTDKDNSITGISSTLTGYLDTWVEAKGYRTDLAASDTDDLDEGDTNFYYTETRFNTSLAAKDSDDLSEGDSNLYYLTERVHDDVNGLLTEGSGITLTYDDNGNTLTIASSITQYADSDARGAISVTDNGGYGSLSYNSSTGVISFTGPSSADIRGEFTAGANITITNGVIAADLSSAEDTNTTYDLTVPASTTSIRLAGSDSTNDDIEIAGTANEITVTRTDASTLTLSQPSDVTIGNDLTVGNDLTITTDASVGGNLTITGNLTVNGTTTTVNSTTVTIDDPIFVLGGDSAASTDDNKDRGIQFEWHNGTDAKTGFFGYDDSEGRFFVSADVSNSSEVITPASYGELHVGSLTSTIGANELEIKTGSWDDNGTTRYYTEIVNSFQDNGIRINEGSFHESADGGSVELLHNGTVKAYVDSTGFHPVGGFSLDNANLIIKAADLQIKSNDSTGNGRGISFYDKLDGTEERVARFFTAGDQNGKMNFNLNINDSVSSGTIWEIREGSAATTLLTVSDGGTFNYQANDITTTGDITANAFYGDGSNLTDITADVADSALSMTVTVKNISGGSLSKGTVVHASPSASPPSGNVIEVIAADKDAAATMPAIGVLNQTLADDAEGDAVMFGAVTGIDTSSFSAGDELWVGDSGAFTNTKPTGASALIQKIAVVIKVHASTGSIKVFGAGRSNDVPNQNVTNASISGTALTLTRSNATSVVYDPDFLATTGGSMSGDLEMEATAPTTNDSSNATPNLQFTTKAKQSDGTAVEDSINIYADYYSIANRFTRLTVNDNVEIEGHLLMNNDIIVPAGVNIDIGSNSNKINRIYTENITIDSTLTAVDLNAAGSYKMDNTDIITSDRDFTGRFVTSEAPLGAVLSLKRDDDSIVQDDLLGRINFLGQRTDGNYYSAGRIDMIADDTWDATFNQESRLEIYTHNTTTDVQRLIISTETFDIRNSGLSIAGTERIEIDGDATLKNVTATSFTGDGSGLTNVSIPTATATTLGGVKIGSGITITSGVISADAQTDNNFTNALKTKLDGIEESANNYSLPTATSSVLGGVKIGSGITISSGVISADSQTDENFTSALKTKLDGIETGATADQTGSEILTALLDVDGALSGLDSDKLDGQDGGYYTNASNISSGTLSSSRLPDTIAGKDVITADKIKGELKTVTLDGQSEVPVDLNTYTNIYCDIGVTGWRGFDLTTLTATAVGNSGTIILHNGGSTDTTLGSPFNFPTEFKTPNGDSIIYVTAAGTTAILSYFVVSTSIVLVNYIGNFQ
jgi:hypothetical protein